jgi:hypothetical protein
MVVSGEPLTGSTVPVVTDRHNRDAPEDPACPDAQSTKRIAPTSAPGRRALSVERSP